MVIVPVVVTGLISIAAISGVFAFDALRGGKSRGTVSLK